MAMNIQFLADYCSYRHFVRDGATMIGEKREIATSPYIGEERQNVLLD
jgi:acyl-[acyl carrier protein]--UDP-N-acetylglucosamine O-acyltransferase